MTDKAYAALVDLVTDICRRNGAKKLLWFGDKAKTLAYTPKAGEMVMTVHRWFANKACPGNYLYERHGQIAAEVNKRLEMEDETVSYEQWKEYMNKYRGELRDNDSSAYSEEARKWATETGLIAGNGTTIGNLPNYMWEDLTTREQLIVVLYRFAQQHGLV